MAGIPFWHPKGLGFDAGRDLLKPLPEPVQWMLMPLFRKYCQIKRNRTTPKFDYSPETINRYLELARNRRSCYYGITDQWLFSAFEDFPVKGLRGLIIGSLQPWYESVALAFGCRSVTVLEYRDQPCGHPQIKFFHVRDIHRLDAPFDFAVSISSVEHDGLGRYGDPVSRNADIEAMAEHKRLLRPDGLLYLSVPVGRDQIVGNMHRVYGRCRLPRLLWGYNVMATYGMSDQQFDTDNEDSACQPVFVLRPCQADRARKPA